MYSFKRTYLFYYTTVITLTLGLCLGLLVILDWPLLAEIPLSICIFIQLLAASKNAFIFWINNKEALTDKLQASIEPIFLKLNSQEEESNYINRDL